MSPSRRREIAMSPAEQAAFLADERTVVCASTGPRGWPHLMPLWYVVRAGELWAWTFGKSQKVRNLERDDRATLQVEAGLEYQELRGVMIEARAMLVRETAVVAELGAELLARYAGDEAEPAQFRDAVAAQAGKRVALRFVPERTVSWDHRKLGGTY